MFEQKKSFYKYRTTSWCIHLNMSKKYIKNPTHCEYHTIAFCGEIPSQNENYELHPAKPNLKSHYGGHRAECTRQLTKMSICTYGILMSSKCGSDCILSAGCTEPGLWIALCPVSRVVRGSKAISYPLTARACQGHYNNAVATGKHPC